MLTNMVRNKMIERRYRKGMEKIKKIVLGFMEQIVPNENYSITVIKDDKSPHMGLQIITESARAKVAFTVILDALMESSNSRRGPDGVYKLKNSSFFPSNDRIEE